jgi:integrase
MLISLHQRGYAESTLEGISKKLRQIAKNADIMNPEKVLEFISTRQSPTTKNLFVQAYDHFARYYNIKWQKPKYRKSEAPIKVPLEENLNYVIETAKSLKRNVAYDILKGTGIRPIELHNLTLENIDLEQGLIHIRSAKHGNPRTLKLKSETLANLRVLIATTKPELKDKIFASPHVLARHWREERLKAYGETGNPELLKIRLYDLRHFYATKLYYNTRDILRVKTDLGHRNIQNTLKYTHVVNFKDDEYHSATARTLDEACKLIEAGFEYVTEMDGAKIFRKRK